MPGRIMPLVTDEVYHVFNRGIDKRPTFTDKREYQRGLEIIDFYKFSYPPISLSKYLVLNPEKQQEIINLMHQSQDQLVDVLAFCLMPNHFHFLLKQKKDKGISKFMAVFQNSYTRYFNTKKERVGPLFLDQFKAVRMEDEGQLLHVMRYIHLNPVTAYLLKDFKQLADYQWSSYREYLSFAQYSISSLTEVRSYFKTIRSFEQFHENQVDYQRSLDKIKHLIFE